MAEKSVGRITASLLKKKGKLVLDAFKVHLTKQVKTHNL
jgi:hypothetical protein